MFFRALFVSLWGLLAAPTAVAVESGPSGLPLPRFVSLASDKVNLRAGPGFRYPIAWVFTRRSVPVEIVGEFGLWRRVRDHEGAEGWVHKALLSGRRTIMVVGGERGLRRAPDAAAPLLARAEPGVHGSLLGCAEEWCEVRLASIRGWIARDHLWGIHSSERFE